MSNDSSGYVKKSNVALAWKENREMVALQARQFMNRALNEALAELNATFQEAVNNGKMLQLDFEKKELRKLLRAAAHKLLT